MTTIWSNGKLRVDHEQGRWYVRFADQERGWIGEVISPKVYASKYGSNPELLARLKCEERMRGIDEHEEKLRAKVWELMAERWRIYDASRGLRKE